MLNRVAIQRVQSLYSAGIQSDDSRLSNRHIFSVLCSVRSQLLAQEQKKGQRVSSFAYQQLPCIELEIAPLNECCGPQSGCLTLKSVHPIPDFLFGASKGIFRLSGLDGNLSISETTFEDKKFKGGNKYTAAKPDFYLRNRYLYVTVTTKLETVTGEGIFVNPIDAYLFPSSCAGKTVECRSYLDYEFPYEGDIESPLILMAAQELIEILSKNKEDKKNNAQESREG